MTGESLFYSFALIDETYIKEAEKPSVSAHKSGTKVLAACLLLVLLLGSVYAVLFNSNKIPVAVTAYSLSEKGTVVENTMFLEKTYPVSRFTTEDGVSVFAFSYKNPDKDAEPQIITIHGTSLKSNGKRIANIKEKDGMVYVYYLFQGNGPYEFTYTTVPDKNGHSYDITVSIREKGSSAVAQIMSVSESKQILSTVKEEENQSTEPLPNLEQLLAPYQEVIDRLNKENGWRISIPEDSKQQVYDYYKDYSMEEFEQEMRREMAEIGY